MKDIENNLYLYFTSRNIKIVNYSLENKGEISLNSVKNQINNIIEFQKKTTGYKDNILPRICGTIGKDLESYKVQVKNLELDLNRIREKVDKNNVDIFILEKGEKLLSRGKRAINYIESSNYEKLIKRSMLGYEICLGRVYESNLRKNENGDFEIGTIKYLSYNLQEHDIYSYLKYVKKRNRTLDINELIKWFIEESILEDDSIKYIIGLLSYPIESLRLWDRYRKSRKKLTEAEYEEAFLRASKNDGIELIAKGGVFSE